MDITFLVGNGFDIAAGLDTSYKGFYKWYCKQPSASPYIECFKREIQEDTESGGENWSDFEIGLGRYTSKFTRETVGQFFECYEDAHEKMIQYLNEECEKFEFAVPKEEVNQLSAGILQFFQELSPQEQSAFSSIFEKDRSNNTVANFISFNYTSLLDNCVDILSARALDHWDYCGSNRTFKVSPSIIHIHGTSNRYPILGVSDTFQVANQELLSVPHFQEIMVKPISINAIGEYWYQNSTDLIKGSKIVCILGMSLGDSDSLWWSTILTWLKDNADRHLIIFWHTKEPVSRLSIFQWHSEVTKVKEKLTDYIDLPEEALKSLKTRMHVVLNTEKVLQVNLKAKETRVEAELAPV